MLFCGENRPERSFNFCIFMTAEPLFHMNPKLAFLVSFFVVNQLASQSLPVFQLGSYDIEKGRTVDIDRYGNQYLSLSYQHSVDASPGGLYDSLQLGGCPNNNNASSFATGLIALDAQGNYKWKLQPSGMNCNAYTAEIGAVAFDSSGYIWVAGGMDGDVDVDPSAGVVTANYDQANFLWKIDTAGNVLTVLTFNAAAPINSYSSLTLAVTPNNDILLSSLFSGTVDTDPGAGTATFSSNGTRDYYIVRLDSNGVFKRSTSFGSADMEQNCRMLVDANEDIYFFGEYQTQIDIAPGPSVYTLIGPGSMYGQACFIVKVDSSFNFIWGGRLGNNTNGQVYPRHLQFAANGDLVVVGLYSGNVDFNPGPTTTYHQSGSLTDPFRLQLNPANGAYQSWYSLYDGAWTYFPSMQAMPGGEMLIYGATTNVLMSDLDPGPGVYPIIPYGGTDMFVMMVDSSFNMKWVKRYPCAANDQITDAATTGNGNYLLSGWFKTTATVEGITMTAGGDEDAFFTSAFIPGNSIEGRVYIDWNNNQVYDGADTAGPLPLFNFENNVITPNYDTISGLYRLFTSAAGTAVLNYLNAPTYFTVNTTQYSFPFGNNVNQSSNQNDFILTPVPGITDFSATVDGMNNRPLGLSAGYSIDVYNHGTTTTGGTVVFYPDSSLTYVNSDVTPASVSTDSIVWNLPAMVPFEHFQFTVRLTMSSNSQYFGDTLPVSVRVYPQLADTVYADNSDTLYQVATGSYDPNFKETHQWTQLDTTYDGTSKALTYTIHFQNTGTANTQYVIVRDTIDPLLLDLSTFTFVQSSHPCLIQVNPGNEILFYFNPIALVPETQSDVYSRGHVTFRLNTTAAFGIGDTIYNRANIFFDANPAVVTAWHSNYIVPPAAPSGVNEHGLSLVSVYPNPANGMLQVNTSGVSRPVQSVITDVSGRLVANGSFQQQMDVSALTAGTYFLSVIFEDGSRSQSTFIINR